MSFTKIDNPSQNTARQCGNPSCCRLFTVTMDVRQKYCTDRCSKAAHRRRRENRENIRNAMNMPTIQPIPALGETFRYQCTVCYNERRETIRDDFYLCTAVNHVIRPGVVMQCRGHMKLKPSRTERRTDTVLGHYHLIDEDGKATSTAIYGNGFRNDTTHTHNFFGKTTSMSYIGGRDYPHIHAELQPTNQRSNEMEATAKAKAVMHESIEEQNEKIRKLEEERNTLLPAHRIAMRRVTTINGQLSLIDEQIKEVELVKDIFTNALRVFVDSER